MGEGHFFRLCDIVEALGLALDLVSGSEEKPLSEHSRRVAYISLRIGEEFRLKREESSFLFLSALLHDAGLVSKKTFLSLRDVDWSGAQGHCEDGYRILKQSRVLGRFAPVIRSHHDRWAGGNRSGLAGDDIPLASRIIYVADRVDMLMQVMGVSGIDGRDRVLEWTRVHRGKHFDPDVVEALAAAASRDAFWFDVTSRLIRERIEEFMPPYDVLCSAGELRDAAGAFARIIDLKTPFTLTHSLEVSRIASRLACVFGFREEDMVLMEVAGLLHDLGKLGIPDEILEKPGRLAPDEAVVMRRHVYDTYVILRSVKGLEEVAEWAAFHHERLDGSGYPFGHSGERLSLGSRIMAAADVFQALNQDRPYRPRIPESQVVRIMRDHADRGQLDAAVISELLKHYDDYAGFCELARDV